MFIPHAVNHHPGDQVVLIEEIANMNGIFEKGTKMVVIGSWIRPGQSEMKYDLSVDGENIRGVSESSFETCPPPQFLTE